VKDDFDSVMVVVEEVDASDLAQNGIVAVISHVVGSDGWKRVAVESEDATFE